MADSSGASSSSQAPGAKRRRVDSGEDGHQTRPSEKYKELQFDDASLVIQCRTASFRVHRSMLSAHSEVFRDMFALAQPGNTGDDGGGLPVVHVSDDAKMMYDFLRALYFHVHPTEGDEDYLCKLLNNWELSRKYAIRSISDHCEKGLRSLFPDDLEEYQRAMKRRSAACNWRGDMLRCITLAKIHDLHIVLPALYQTVCEVFPLWTPEDVFEDEDWPTDPVVAVTLYSGRHNLVKLKRDAIDMRSQELLEQDEFHCARKFSSVLLNRFTQLSTNNLTDYLDELELFRADGTWSAADKTLGARRLCDKCRQLWRDSEREGMEEAWERLPGCFHLGTWGELREKDKRASSRDRALEDHGDANNGGMDETE